MDINVLDCRALIVETFEKVKMRNSSYSLSAFARDLGISHTYLFRVINNERSASPELAYKLSKYLKLSNDESLRLIVSTLNFKDNDK